MSRSTISDQTARDAQALDCAKQLASEVLRPHANATDSTGAWPREQLRAIAAAGLAGIAIPQPMGGLELSYLAQARVFTALAEGGLATAFIMTQHHACTTLVDATPHESVRRRWLPGLASGELHGANGFNFLNFPPERAPMKATPVAGGYRLDGVLPWVTAAHHSDLLVAGAVLPDGMQLLVAIPLRAELASGRGKISVDAPMDLMALAASDTTVVRCDGYEVAAADVMLGPGPDLLKTTFRGGTPYVPTAMTIGHARASLQVIEEVAARKQGTNTTMPDWLRTEISRLDDAVTAALTAGDFARAPELRGQGNALVTRAAHLALIAGGGTGYKRDQTPQRLYREAAFFSVWSVSGTIIPETLTHLITGEL